MHDNAETSNAFSRNWLGNGFCQTLPVSGEKEVGDGGGKKLRQ